jgi:hypothetical protein
MRELIGQESVKQICHLDILEPMTHWSTLENQVRFHKDLHAATESAYA